MNNYENARKDMKKYSKEKLVFDELILEGIRFVPNTIGEILSFKDNNYLKYISKNNGNNYDNCDSILAFNGDECVGAFIGESILNPIVKVYAGKDDPLYSIRMLFAKDEKILKIILEYIEKLARARGEIYTEFNNENKEYEEFYSYLKNYDNVEEVGKYLIYYCGYNSKKVVEGYYEIRKTYIGEEYDIGKGAPLDLEEGETNLGYIENDNLKYSYGMDYIVGYDNSKNGYFGYVIGETIRVTDTTTYNCYFIKDFFIFEESDFKYELANKLFDYIIYICKYMSCKCIKIMINNDKRFSYFYDYCKQQLGMIEENGYLNKNIIL